jgi:hypothetical protein
MPLMDLNGTEITRLHAQAATNEKQGVPVVTGDLLIGHLCVMSSSAGYYIGRPCIEAYKVQKRTGVVEWFPQPYNRETGYFPTKVDAQVFYKETVSKGDWR